MNDDVTAYIKIIIILPLLVGSFAAMETIHQRYFLLEG